MNLILDISQKYKILSIVGMAKNAGKTTALNYLIEEAADEQITLGITSTGRDGETQDLVTGTEKPKVFLYEDTLVTIPTSLYNFAEAGLEIIKKSKYRTSLGELLICKVINSGYVQIAGPTTTSESKELCEELLSMGASLILIDGAIDRRSIASPEISEAVILSTGAVVSRSQKKVVDETVHVVSLYTLPELHDNKIIKIISDNTDDKILVISDNEVKILNLLTGLGSSRYIDEAINDETKYVYIPGAFTSSVISDIHYSKLKRITFILKNPSKIFIDSLTFNQLQKKGLSIRVINNIEIAAITVNPISPSGYSFDREILLNSLENTLPHIPIVDVRM